MDDSLAYGKDVAHVQNFYRVNTTSKEDVKKAVMDYGAVSISYWSDQSSDWSTQYYNSLTAAYYCPEGHITNHAVNIVGWDDDAYEKSLGWEFVNSPDHINPETGAQFLSELYYNADPEYTGRATVPSFVDYKEKKVVNLSLIHI